MTRRSINVIQFWLKIGFFAIPGIGFATAGYIRFEWINLPRTQLDLHAYIVLTVFVSFMWVLVVEHLKLDRIETLLTIQTGIKLTARATVYCVALALSGLFFYRGITFARIFVVLGCVLMFILSLVMIHLFRGVIRVLGISSNGHFRVAIVGADDFASRVSRHLVSNHFLPFDIACFVALPDQVAAALDCPILDWSGWMMWSNTFIAVKYW